MKTFYKLVYVIYYALTLMGSVFYFYTLWFLSFVLRAIMASIPFYFCYNYIANLMEFTHISLFSSLIINILIALVFNHSSEIIQTKIRINNK